MLHKLTKTEKRYGQHRHFKFPIKAPSPPPPPHERKLPCRLPKRMKIAPHQTSNASILPITTYFRLKCFYSGNANIKTKWIRPDEGLTLETSALEFLYSGEVTLSFWLIKPNVHFENVLLKIISPRKHALPKITDPPKFRFEEYTPRVYVCNFADFSVVYFLELYLYWFGIVRTGAFSILMFIWRMRSWKGLRPALHM